jgi:hypothetical protein
MEKAPSLRLGDLTYQGLMDLLDFYRVRPQLISAQQADILEYFSAMFANSQFTGFIEPMMAFIKENGWEASTDGVERLFDYIPPQIRSSDDFSMVLKQSRVLSSLTVGTHVLKWQEQIKYSLVEFFKQLPAEQLPVFVDQLPTWVLSQMVADYSQQRTKVVHGRLELMIKEVEPILRRRNIQDEQKTILIAIEQWGLAIKNNDKALIHNSEQTIKDALNMPNQTTMGLFRSLREWILAQGEVPSVCHEWLDQLELYYQAVPIMRQLVLRIRSMEGYVLSDLDREHIRSWWPVLAPFLTGFFEEKILDDLRTPICSNLEKLEGLLGLSRDAIIKTLQGQLKTKV